MILPGRSGCRSALIEWRNNGFDPSRVEVPFVYEAHVGMGGEEGRVHTYREFADEVLPGFPGWVTIPSN